MQIHVRNCGEDWDWETTNPTSLIFTLSHKSYSVCVWSFNHVADIISIKFVAITVGYITESMRHNCITRSSYALLSNAMCFGRVPYRTFKICFAVLPHFTVIPVYSVLFSINLGFILCCMHLMFQFWFGNVIQDSRIRQSVAVNPWFAENTVLQWKLCTYMVFSEYASDCCLFYV